jgi:hypothetical protein
MPESDHRSAVEAAFSARLESARVLSVGDVS